MWRMTTNIDLGSDNDMQAPARQVGLSQPLG
jgi:hypothetical protein